MTHFQFKFSGTDDCKEAIRLLNLKFDCYARNMEYFGVPNTYYSTDGGTRIELLSDQELITATEFIKLINPIKN